MVIKTEKNSVEYFMGTVETEIKNMNKEIRILSKAVMGLQRDVNGIKIKLFGFGAAGAILAEILATLFK